MTAVLDPVLARAADAVASVADPELPMLTLAELGIVRAVALEGQAVVVTLTPTYSGCPAIAEMRHDVRRRLQAAGFTEVEIRTELAPAWTSDAITESGRRKLLEAGIAPPGPAPRRGGGPIPLTLTPRPAVRCPHCGSADSRLTSAFGATACRALYRCAACAEPFEYVKEI